MYARGILFGKMKYELGDHSFVRCPENHLAADIEFKTKGWVGGTYNAIGGTIKNEQTGEILFELSGYWSGEMTIKNTKTGQKKPLFDATHAKHAPPLARPLEEQGERESQRLWKPTVQAVHVRDHELATTEKAKIEDRQREEAKRREELGVEWKPKLFRRVDARAGGTEEGEEDLEWIINTNLDPKASPKELVDKILSIAPIIPGQVATEQDNKQQSRSNTASQPPAPQLEHNNLQVSGNLIDFDSRPPSTAPPEHPPTQSKSNQPQPTHQRTASLMDDDDHLNAPMSKLNMHEAMKPEGQKPLKRTDTETSELEVFVDAEG
ncbi:Oxysterol-binding protein OBPa [Cladophialophora chaetospira]|uniref:Oxysterol-binding protein OBPa n=1 Tax=Cladophialophora chaetospira TaxID=386627 RepID=A0AA38XP62_9EURO|nr:Oxysterol-binding protein OBPa [Cladophialophora chaetospira]